jgi:hypothetical protein
MIIAVVVIIAAGGVSFAVLGGTSSPNGAAQHSQAPLGSYIFASPADGFQARFPEPPLAENIPESIGPIRLLLNGAETQNPMTVAVKESILTPLTADSGQQILQAALTDYATQNRMTNVSQLVTTYHGLAARSATYKTASGGSASALVFFNSAVSFYFIEAPSGTIFNQLMTSLQLLP